MSSESASPTKKRLKLPGSSVAGDDDGDNPVSLKGLKKSQVKKMEKEQQRLEKKAQKEQEKKAVAERKRLRGESESDFCALCALFDLQRSLLRDVYLAMGQAAGAKEGQICLTGL